MLERWSAPSLSRSVIAPSAEVSYGSRAAVLLATSTGTLVFLCDNLTWRRYEFGTKLATPCAVFEALVLPRGSLNRRNVGPRFVVACTISMMHGIEDAKLHCARGI